MILDMDHFCSLTKPQRLVLEAFKRRVQRGLPPPTYRELCTEFGWRSTGTARDHLRALIRKGLIDPAGGKARGTQLHDKRIDQVLNLPLLGHVIAGKPVVSEEHVEEEIPIPAFLITDHDSFLLRVRGDSMEGAGIFEGDIVVVRHTNYPQDNKIAAVTIDGDTTLKRLVRHDSSWLLVPENPKYKPIQIRVSDLVIHGVVTGLLRSLPKSTRRIS